MGPTQKVPRNLQTCLMTSLAHNSVLNTNLMQAKVSTLCYLKSPLKYLLKSIELFEDFKSIFGTVYFLKSVIYSSDGFKAICAISNRVNAEK